MMSVDAKPNVKEQEIKEQVAISSNFSQEAPSKL